MLQQTGKEMYKTRRVFC